MPTPQFILDLRAKIGHDMLWLPGCTAVVFDDDGRVLLVKRADNGRWALVTGILEPGEQPAIGAVREVLEETAVVAEAERLLSVTALPLVEYYNGDRTTYLDVTFRCRYVSGEARVNDDESVDVGWFALDELPDIPERHTACIKDALTPEATPARFALS
jgi:8-oxo-dGTP pyrophosphatase MutT (NUDIX family)